MIVRTFYNYILTNPRKSVFYTGVTKDLARRLIEHYIGTETSFTSRYSVNNLIWFETTKYILNAIHRENEIKDFFPAKEN